MEKPTLKTPTEQGKAFEKNVKISDNKAKAIVETDNMLNEKEQSLKKKIFDLSKMESLVHTDEKLSGIYNEMALEGEEMYGYHYNETIMNIIFNDYILNDPIYLEKYKNAIPKEKKRRDKSGIHQLQVAGEKEMSKSVDENESAPKNAVTDDQSNDMEELSNKKEMMFNIDETTSAGGAAGAMGDASRASGYAYTGPFGKDRHSALDTPLWKGGSIVSENYLINPQIFKNMLNEEIMNQDFSSPNNDTLVPMSEHHLSSREDKINFIIQNTSDADQTLSPDDFEMLDDEEINQAYLDTEEQMGMNEKAESKSQQRFMGMVRGVQKGDVDPNTVGDSVKKAASDMSPSDVKDFASTKHNDLPEKVNEIDSQTFMNATTQMRDKNQLARKKQLVNNYFREFINRPIVDDSIKEIDADFIDGYIGLDIVLHDGRKFTYSANKNGDEAFTLPKDGTRKPIDLNRKDVRILSLIVKKINPNTKYSNGTGDLPVGDYMYENAIMNEETYSRLRKIEYYDKFNELQNVDDIINGTIPEEELSTLTDKPIKITLDDDTEERLTYDEFNELYGHNDDIPMDVKDLGNEPNQMGDDNVEIGNLDSPMGDMKESTMIEPTRDSMISDNPTSMKMSQSPEGDDFAVSQIGMTENADDSERYVEYYKDYESEVPFNRGDDTFKYVWAKYPNGKVDIGVYSQKQDLTYGYDWFRKNILGINESKQTEKSTIAEDGHCRKDEVPVPGKLPHEEGSCKKKLKGGVIRPEEKKRSPHNVKQREKRLKDYENKIEMEKNKKKRKQNEEFSLMEKELNEMKNYLNNLSEERRPSALVTLDRLKKENETNFNQDVKSNISNDIELGDMHNDLVTNIDDPQKFSNDIEAEKMKQHKGKSFDNVGDSANENNKEIPKRNLTKDESDEVDLMRQGMEDIVYDNKPTQRFEDRMKDDMGDDVYTRREKKMEYKAGAPMYNKDTQPIDDGKETNQFDKNKSKFNSVKPVDENYMFTGKYKNELGMTKFINFTINETIAIDSINDDLKELKFDGLGNAYTQKVNENINYKFISENKFYTNGIKTFILTNKTELIKESVEENKNQKINIDGIRKLINYSPSEFIDINKTKKNRGF